MTTASEANQVTHQDRDLKAARLMVHSAVLARDMLDYIADVLPEDQAKEIR